MAHKVHHLNCATLCPGTRRLMEGRGSYFAAGKLICHCLLIETNEGLILVDTGFSLQDVTKGLMIDKLMLKTFNARCDPEECAINQIRGLGYQPEEVKHIIVTHLDRDHVGGIKDFPGAQVHLLAEEWAAAMDPSTIAEKWRYSPRDWRHSPNWSLHRVQGETWFGFDSVQVLSDALFEILLIPLVGHSRGHAGVAVSTHEGWLLHCGDAYFHRNEIRQMNWSRPLGIKAIQFLDDVARADRINNQKRLAHLAKMHSHEVRLICSHDEEEFNACCAKYNYSSHYNSHPDKSF